MVTIELLVEHEETIGKLYEAYASEYPEYKTFWSTLSYEEKDHAEKIRSLINERKLGHVTFDSTKYDAKSIETSITYITQQLNRLDTEEVSLVRAFSIALDIEKAIIDGKVFEAFKGHTQKTRELIRDLAKSVTDHYQVIEQTWLEHRRYR